ncbi:MAG: hypothetical protein AAB581_03465 [Patescibacteria group bacterium]
MRVVYHKNFEKKFRKLPAKVKERFYGRLALFYKNKHAKTLNNHSVDTAYPGVRSINITGDYRALFYDVGETVTFLTIGTHTELY